MAGIVITSEGAAVDAEIVDRAAAEPCRDGGGPLHRGDYGASRGRSAGARRGAAFEAGARPASPGPCIAGLDLAKIQARAGHDSISTTMGYVKAAEPPACRLRDAVPDATCVALSPW
jgi:hypothetical protein